MKYLLKLLTNILTECESSAYLRLLLDTIR